MAGADWFLQVTLPIGVLLIPSLALVMHSRMLAAEFEILDITVVSGLWEA
jgi:hypothetical protein